MNTRTRPAFRSFPRAAGLLIGVTMITAIIAPLAQMAAQISAL